MSSRAEYLDAWSGLHDDIRPRDNWLIHGWLTVAYFTARPFAAVGMSANAVTVLGVFVSGLVPALAFVAVQANSGLALWAATLMIPVAGLVDSLDGAVAIIRGQTSEFGYVLDSVCDRISEVAIIAALGIVGGNWFWIVAAMLLGFLLEYERARVRAVQPHWDPPLTIAERPTRLIIVGVFLGLSALAPYGVDAGGWATLGGVLGTIVALVGVAQLTWALSRHLRAQQQSGGE